MLTVYVGTYSQRGSEGIYHLEWNPENESIHLQDVTPAGENPSYLAIHPNKTSLYCVNEIINHDGQLSGAVSAFHIEEDGHLRFLNRQPSLGGHPCHVSVEPSERMVLAANYSGGSVIALPIHADGSLGKPCSHHKHPGSGPDPLRQEMAHAHSIHPSPSGKYAVTTDLGIDKLIIYKIDPLHDRLIPHGEAVSAPRSGPRQAVFHPNGKFLYVVNELDDSVTVFEWNEENGAASSVQTCPTLPDSFSETNYPAEIDIHPSGRFLFASNRGHDSIALYSVNSVNGTISCEGHVSVEGRNPRQFSISPDGKYLFCANQDTDNISFFKIEEDTGKLIHLPASITIPCPICITFLS